MPVLDQLDHHPEAKRIRSRRLTNGVASLIVDATGLDEAAKAALEQGLRETALAIPGVGEARVALTAAKRGRTLVAIGSGKMSCRRDFVPFSVTVPSRQSMSSISRFAISPARSPMSSAQRTMA